MRCLTFMKGYVDPHSPVSKKGYKIEAIWFEGNKKCFSISYLQEEENAGYSTDKKALEEAVNSFQRFIFHALGVHGKGVVD